MTAPNLAERAVDDRDLWLMQMEEAGHVPATIVHYRMCGTCVFWREAQCRWSCKCPHECRTPGRSIKAHTKGSECDRWAPIPVSEVSSILSAIKLGSAA